MSSMNTYSTISTPLSRGQALVLSQALESNVATEILSINVLSILGLVLIIINAALIA